MKFTGHTVEMICKACLSIRPIELATDLTIDTSKFTSDSAKTCFCGGRLVLVDSVGGAKLAERKKEADKSRRL
jgi:hypothetical protein